jgi:hypothetical protein
MAAACVSRMRRRAYPLAAEPVIEYCLPTLGRSVPHGPLWAHEFEHDGFANADD